MTIRREYLIAFFTWACITMFYCYQYILRMLPNIIMPELMTSFGVRASEFGSFASIYYIGYITVHIPIGILLSRFSSKAVLPIFILLATLGLAPINYSDNWHMVVAGRLFVGIGSSAAIVGALQIFRSIFHTGFSRMLGIMVSLSLFTLMFGNNVLTKAVSSLGVEGVINTLIIIGIVLSIFTFVLLPKENNLENGHGTIIEDLKSILGNYKLIIVSLLAGLMVGPLEGFADAWGSAFINAKYAIDRETAGAIISLILIGMCAGCIILPYIADRFDSHHGVTLASAITMTFCFAYLVVGQGTGEWILRVISCTIGFFCAYQVVIISKISTYVPEPLSGMAAAVANMIIMSFGSIFHKVIGITVDAFWNGEMSGEIRLYDAVAYVSGISVIPIAMVIACIGFTLVIFRHRP